MNILAPGLAPVYRRIGSRTLLFGFVLGFALLLGGCERTASSQNGFRGTGLFQMKDPAAVARNASLHSIPEPEPVDPPEADAPSISDVFKNVQVLNDLTVLEFSRLMQALSTWVAPEEGCDFCHNPRKLDSDEKYTKVVARQMLLMTRQINTEWKQHVGATGVTCWTCHRGQAVPSGDWFANPGSPGSMNNGGNRAVQNQGGVRTNGNTALPVDALSAYLLREDDVRIQGTKALRNGDGLSIKNAEWTYSLMMYMSNSLGVNCTFCHNSRALANWKESTPQRVTAWHGIRMVRHLNEQWLEPVGALLPANRLSPTGDWPKVACETCHKGVNKPLNGVTMLDDYPELRGVMVRPEASTVEPPKVAAAAR
jgi:photosynthetic reaction center cytochrome c subunit